MRGRRKMKIKTVSALWRRYGSALEHRPLDARS
jgi:hypothetical protein